MDLCELLPRQAKLADKFTLIRSCSHSEADHMKGAQYMLTGRTSPGPNGLEPDVRYPDLSAIIKWAGPTGRSGLPSCVGVPRRHESAGAGYLGMAYEPFEVQANPNKADFEVPNLGLPATGTRRLRDRVELLRNFDALRRDLGQRELLEAMDSYDQEAVRLLTSDAARKAFDLKGVEPRERDRYGRSYVGQNLLLARRLVEAQLRDEADRGRTVLFSSHDLTSVERLCHRAAFLRRGEIVRSGAAAELAAETGRLLHLELRTAVNEEQLPQQPGWQWQGHAERWTLQHRDPLEEVLARISELPLAGIRDAAGSLEEVFDTLYGEDAG